MANNNKFFIYLLLISIIPIFFKWAISIYYFGFNISSLSLFNLQDIQYFPILYSFSEFNFSPTYIESISSDKIIGYPLLGLIIHSLAYKFLNIYGFVILELGFQILFVFIFFKVFEIVFEDKQKSFIFLILVLILTSIFGIISQYNFNFFFTNLSTIFDDNFGTRFPRPLITGPFIFLSFLFLIRFKTEFTELPKYSYIFYFSLTLGVLFNTFFSYFFNYFFLLLIVFLINFTKLKYFTLNHYYRYILFLILLLIFISPFIIQNFYSDLDYSNRLGTVELNFNQKIFVLKYFFIKLIDIKFLVLLVISISIFILNNIFNNKTKNKKNIFFYFILSSILSFLFFLFLSPKIISLYHFIDILKFSVIFYILIELFDLFYTLIIKTKFKYLIKNISIYILILTFVCLSFIYTNNNLLKDKIYKNQIVSIEKFLDDNNLRKIDYKLFTNDIFISNLWLQKKNSNLIISDGFTNSLQNFQIEFNLFNSLKIFGFDNTQFSEFISLGSSEIRNPFFLFFFNYLYQANSLTTYSNIVNYSEDIKDFILNTSPFRVQIQIIPEDEKKRFIKYYKKLNINEDLQPDYVIINNITIPKNFKMFNIKYNNIFSTKDFDIYLFQN